MLNESKFNSQRNGDVMSSGKRRAIDVYEFPQPKVKKSKLLLDSQEHSTKEKRKSDEKQNDDSERKFSNFRHGLKAANTSTPKKSPKKRTN